MTHYLIITDEFYLKYTSLFLRNKEFFFKSDPNIVLKSGLTRRVLAGRPETERARLPTINVPAERGRGSSAIFHAGKNRTSLPKRASAGRVPSPCK